MEADELGNQQQGEDLCKEQDINDLKHRMTTITQDYYFCFNAFRVFEGKEQKAITNKDIMHLQDSALPINETQIYLTEENFKQNFKNVFGVD